MDAMTPITILLAALLLAGKASAADFMQTVTGEAPLRSEQDQASCSKAAEDGLAKPRADLEKQCQEDGGLFNLGLVTTEIHTHSCTAQQIATCTGTNTPPKAADSTKKPSLADSRDPADHPADRTPFSPKTDPKPKKAKPTHLKKLGPPPADDDLAPKPDKPRKPKKHQPDTSPSNEVREVRAP